MGKRKGDEDDKVSTPDSVRLTFHWDSGEPTVYNAVEPDAVDDLIRKLQEDREVIHFRPHHDAGTVILRWRLVRVEIDGVDEQEGPRNQGDY